MVREVETSSQEEMTDVSGDRLEVAGTFHCIVDLMKDGEMPYSDDDFDGFSARLRVVEGDHAGKTLGVLLRDPNDSHSDKGAFCRRRQTAFFIATELMAVGDINKSVSIDEGEAADAQVICKFKFGKANDDGVKYLDLDGEKVYHVDDPRVADVPKCKDELSDIDKDFRRDAAYFAPILPKESKKKKKAAPVVNEDGL